MTSSEKSSLKVIVLLPVYNDWESLERLLATIENQERHPSIESISYVAMNDSSSEPFEQGRFRGIKDLEVVELTRNMGHQRAIAIGLSYIANNKDSDAVVVMDSDGEDKPEDINKLVDKMIHNSKESIIFASRTNRQENLAFQFLYNVYKILFHLLTGSRISFGNFCIIPRSLLLKTVHISELWNNFPGAIIKSNLPIDTVSLARGKRLVGKSKMSLVSLIIHGLGAISVHIDTVAIRLLIVTIVVICLLFLGVLALIGIKVYSVIALPGWTSIVLLGLSSILLQAFLILMVLAFVILTFRSQKLFIPHYDYQNFILTTTKKA